MKESDVEKYLVDEVKKRGGICPKFVSPGLRGVPDRIMMIPKGIIAFIELKAPGEKPSKQQEVRMQEFTLLGQACLVIDNKDGVDRLMKNVDDALRAEWEKRQKGGGA